MAKLGPHHAAVHQTVDGRYVAFLLAFAGLVLGLAIGSFLNVVIYRVPRRLSIISPGSACPNCGALVAPYDNIPVISWFVLRAKCRNCGHPISGRYPLVEAATGLSFALICYSTVLWGHPFGWAVLGCFLAACVIVLIGVISDQDR